jgi:protein-disulfide isomerase
MDEPKLTKKERKELKKQQEAEKATQQKHANTVSTVLKWIVFSAIVILGVFLLLGAFKNDRTTTLPPEISSIIQTDHITGSPNKTNVLIEYSDFQCPACAATQPIINQLIKEHGNTITLVYRHFPLPAHKNARPASYAAEAAGLQSKFWEMHDLLFSRQAEWEGLDNPNEKFASYAQELELNVEQFTTDSDSQMVKDKVESDYQSGIQAAVMATPTFYYNGVYVKPFRSYNDFVSSLNLQ